MGFKISIQDTVGINQVQNSIEVEFQEEVVTLKVVIETRVRKEVDDFNTKLPDYFNGLVQPTSAEKTLNGYRMRERKKIDAETQVYIALDAFQKGAYFVMVNSRQVESLEDKVKITADAKVRFMKLTPLVGG